MEKTKTRPEDYINSLPPDKKQVIKTLDKLITEVLPTVNKVMWEGVFWGGSEQKIIGYGNYTQTRPNKTIVEWYVVGLAQQKNYVTVFVNAVKNDQYIAEIYKDQLRSKNKKVKIGKSTISFERLEDIDLDVLKKVIKEGFELAIRNL